MATIETAVANLETILRDDLPAILALIDAEKKDGIKLEPIRSFEWEETREAIKQTPACLLIGVDESDVVLRDQVRDATIQLFLVVDDRDKKSLTKRLYRYATALRRVLRPATNRTLATTIISAKIVRVTFSPTFVDRDNMFARDLQAEIVLRMPKEGD